MSSAQQNSKQLASADGTCADIRDPSTAPVNTKSINLALSERGINSLRRTGLSDLADAVLADTVPMHGRMIHLKKNGEYVREAQQYDAHGRVSDFLIVFIWSIH